MTENGNGIIKYRQNGLEKEIDELKEAHQRDHDKLLKLDSTVSLLLKLNAGIYTFLITQMILVILIYMRGG